MAAKGNILTQSHRVTEKVRLGEVCKLVRGVSYKPQDAVGEARAGYVPLLRANNIGINGLNHDDLVYVKCECVHEDQFVCKGDLLVCASSGSKHLVGKAAQISFDGKETFGAFCKVIRPNARKCDFNYLANYFQSDVYRRTISDKAAGANINNIRSEHLEELQILLPPLAEQKRIAAVLDKICELKKNAEAQIENLDLFVKSRFSEMFGDLVANDRGWEFSPLGKVCDVRDGTHASPKYHTQGYPLMTSKNFTEGYEDFSDVKLISKEDFDEINKRSRVDLGDIVMPMIGTIGNPVIIKTDREFAIKNVSLIKFTNESPINMFVKAVLSSQYFQRVVEEKNRGNTQKFIALGDIRGFLLPLPPLALQREFAAFVEKVDKLKDVAKKSVEEMDTLYRAKLQEYFG